MTYLYICVLFALTVSPVHCSEELDKKSSDAYTILDFCTYKETLLGLVRNRASELEVCNLLTAKVLMSLPTPKAKSTGNFSITKGVLALTYGPEGPVKENDQIFVYVHKDDHGEDEHRALRFLPEKTITIRGDLIKFPLYFYSYNIVTNNVMCWSNPFDKQGERSQITRSLTIHENGYEIATDDPPIIEAGIDLTFSFNGASAMYDSYVYNRAEGKKYRRNGTHDWTWYDLVVSAYGNKQKSEFLFVSNDSSVSAIASRSLAPYILQRKKDRRLFLMRSVNEGTKEHVPLGENFSLRQDYPSEKFLEPSLYPVMFSDEYPEKNKNNVPYYVGGAAVGVGVVAYVAWRQFRP